MNRIIKNLRDCGLDLIVFGRNPVRDLILVETGFYRVQTACRRYAILNLFFLHIAYLTARCWNSNRFSTNILSLTGHGSFRATDYRNQTNVDDELMSYGQWNPFSHSFSIDMYVLRTIWYSAIARRAFISIKKYNNNKYLPVGHQQLINNS